MISLNSCRMQSLENFPVVSSLTRVSALKQHVQCLNLDNLCIKVELSENQIKGSDLAPLAASTSITTLKLANNKIDSVSDLLALVSFQSIRLIFSRFVFFFL